jgi:hypothetical protein
VNDPVEALLQAASSALLRAAVLSFVAGMLWAALAAGAIYLGATRLKPRIARGRVWAEWRQRWPFWLLCPALGTAGSILSGEAISRLLTARSLYWIEHPAEILTICRLGGLCGYLLVLLVCVFGSMLKRRRRTRRG